MSSVINVRLNEKMTLRFVELYRDQRILWDKEHEGYNKRSDRLLAYRRIADGMAVDGMGVPEVASKIKNIRSTYLQELKKIKESAQRHLRDRSVVMAAEDQEEDQEDAVSPPYVPKLLWFPILDAMIGSGTVKRLYSSASAAADMLTPHGNRMGLDGFTLNLGDNPVTIKKFEKHWFTRRSRVIVECLLFTRCREKIAKSYAQRQKEYRERKKIEKLLQGAKKIPKTNAERQKQFRQNQRKTQQNETLNLARKIKNAERAKRYRDKLKSKKQRAELDSLPTLKEESLPTYAYDENPAEYSCAATDDNSYCYDEPSSSAGRVVKRSLSSSSSSSSSSPSRELSPRSRSLQLQKQQQQQHQQQQQSSTELFAKYIATSLDALPPRLAVWAQKDLHDVLVKYKLMELDRDGGTSTGCARNDNIILCATSPPEAEDIKYL